MILSYRNNNTNLHCSDRFLIGGTNNFRGFVPDGIGPRAYVNTSDNTATTRTGKAGNSSGGDLFYTTIFMARTALPDIIRIWNPFIYIHNHRYLDQYGFIITESKVPSCTTTTRGTTPIITVTPYTVWVISKEIYYIVVIYQQVLD